MACPNANIRLLHDGTQGTSPAHRRRAHGVMGSAMVSSIQQLAPSVRAACGAAPRVRTGSSATIPGNSPSHGVLRGCSCAPTHPLRHCLATRLPTSYHSRRSHNPLPFAPILRLTPAPVHYLLPQASEAAAWPTSDAFRTQSLAPPSRRLSQLLPSLRNLCLPRPVFPSCCRRKLRQAALRDGQQQLQPVGVHPVEVVPGGHKDHAHDFLCQSCHDFCVSPVQGVPPVCVQRLPVCVPCQRAYGLRAGGRSTQPARSPESAQPVLACGSAMPCMAWRMGGADVGPGPTEFLSQPACTQKPITTCPTTPGPQRGTEQVHTDPNPCAPPLDCSLQLLRLRPLPVSGSSCPHLCSLLSRIVHCCVLSLLPRVTRAPTCAAACPARSPAPGTA